MNKNIQKNRDLFEVTFKNRLQKLFPTTVKNGVIDFEALLNELGEYNKVDDNEKYDFTWVGKKEAIKKADEDIVGKTLKYIPEDSKNPNTTQNLYIEGDNLEVLKLLKDDYRGKVKMIYIDPPYNTGKKMIYNDNFRMTKKEYNKLTNEINENNLNGRYHSKWLTMMYPRLKVAKDLLTDDGVIFISIDDNEVHNLRKLCDIVFDENNFITEFAWRRTNNQANIGSFANVKEYILCYAKTKNSCDFKLNKLPLSDKAIKEYLYTDDKGKFRRKNILDKSRGKKIYSITAPSGDKLNGPWMVAEDEFNKLIAENKIYWANNKMPYGKKYLFESEGQIISNWLTKEFGTNQRASNEIDVLFGDRLFDFPKPTKLLKTFITIGSKKEDIILDFFSGSATTAHSTMQLNAEDGGKRKYIMVQLPEPTSEKSEAYKTGYKNISEIGKERIRRAGEKILEENKDKEGIENLDVGFKVFKVADTN